MSKRFKSKEELFYGKEILVWDDSIPYNAQIARYYNYYNNAVDSKKKEGYLKKYINNNKISISKVDIDLYGPLVRMIDLGFPIKQKHKDRLNKFNNIVPVKKVEIVKKREEVPQNVTDLYSNFDETLDKIQDGMRTWDYNKIQVPPKYNKEFHNYVQSLLDDLNNDDVNETYETKKLTRNRMVKFINEVLSKNVVIKKQSKPRKIKSLTKERRVKGIKFLPKFDELKIKSFDPTHILDAKQLWIYHTKRRILVTAYSENGFDVKGGSLLNVDKCLGKMIRKPEENITKFTGIAYNKIDNEWDDLTTKVKEDYTSRITKDCIILNVRK